MSYSFTTSIGDGVTKVYPFSFAGQDLGYLAVSNVVVFVAGVPVPFTIPSNDPNKAYLVSAPPFGAEVLIRRVMPKNVPYSDFTRGNPFSQDALNNTNLQQLYIVQEILDGYMPTGFYFKSDINMGGYKLVNLGEGTQAGDSVRYEQWLDNKERLDRLELGLVDNVAQRTIPWYYIATGGEIELSPPYDFQAALVFRGGMFQNQGLGAFSIANNKIKLAEPLEPKEEFYALLGSSPATPDDYAKLTEVIRLIESSKNTRELWRRSLAEVGLTLVPGSFRESAVVNSPTDAVWDEVGAQCYTWTGVFPYTAVGEPGGGWVSVQIPDNKVNIKIFLNAMSDFSTAVYSAIEKCNNTLASTVYIPSGTYTSTSTIDNILVKNLSFEFESGVIINHETPVNLFDINIGGYTLDFIGSGVEIYPAWVGVTNTATALRFTGWSLKRNFTLENVNVMASATGVRFLWAFWGSGLNYPTISNSLLQAINSVYISSQLTQNTSTHSMGAEFTNIRCLATDVGVRVHNQGALGAEGFRFTGGEVLADIGFQTIDNVAAGYYPPGFTINGTHINARVPLDLNGISRVQVKADIQAKVSNSNFASGLIELGGVQSFVLDGGSVTHSVVSGSSITDAKPIVHFKSHPVGKLSAFADIGTNVIWLSSANTKLLSFESDGVYSGRVGVSLRTSSAFSSKIVDKAYINKVLMSEDFPYQPIDLTEQLANSTDATFSGGVLTLGKKPLTGSYYRITSSIVPDGSVITGMVCDAMKGRYVDILFESANINFTHSTTLLLPGTQNIKHSGARFGIRVYFVNQNTPYITGTSGVNFFTPKLSPPVNSLEPGRHGQKIFSEGYVYEYLDGTGWVRYPAATF